jgi:hypothetical protein
LGSGLALLKRENASCTSAGVQGFAEGSAEALGVDARRTLAAAAFADLFGCWLAVARSEDFLTKLLTGFLADFFAIVFGPKDGLRVIFDMIGIY